MFNDDHFTRYVNDRFPAIGDSQRRKTKESSQFMAPLVFVERFGPHSDNHKDSVDKTARPFSEAA